MDNAYKQKLQERAILLHKKWAEIDLGQHDAFYLLAALTLEWSAADLIKWMDNYAWTLEGKEEYLIKNGFISPKTDDNEG